MITRMRNFMKKNSNEGFTLIELMIVIAIIGILAAIAVPQFMAYRTRAYNATAKATCHNVQASESDLNAELGCYGHTEASPATLVAGDGGAAVMDTSVAANAAAAVEATATAQGGRIVGTNPTTGKVFAVACGFGTNMAVQAQETAGTAAACTVVARHINGDTAYGMDSEVPSQTYSVSNTTWRGAAGLGATFVASTDNLNDFDNDNTPNTGDEASGGGKPDDPWRAI